MTTEEPVTDETVEETAPGAAQGGEDAAPAPDAPPADGGADEHATDEPNPADGDKDEEAEGDGEDNDRGDRRLRREAAKYRTRAREAEEALDAERGRVQQLQKQVLTRALDGIKVEGVGLEPGAAELLRLNEIASEFFTDGDLDQDKLTQHLTEQKQRYPSLFEHPDWDALKVPTAGRTPSRVGPQSRPDSWLNGLHAK